jgi:Uma2 family endonuclease
MTAAKKYIPHYSIEDYARWEGDWELWQGVPVSMAPGPFGRHQVVAGDLLVMLREALRAATCHATAIHELDWIVSSDTVVRPDVLVVCGDPPERYLETPPALVVEVLSDSTRDRDRTYKRDLYESQGVPSYLIADPDSASWEAFVLGESGKYEAASITNELKLTLCQDCEITLAIGSLF